MSAAGDSGFFVGWSGRTGRPLALFLAIVAAATLGGFVALAVVLSGSIDDPGDGDFDMSGAKTLQGVLTLRPYPLLRLPADAAHPQGHLLMLAGEGKLGASVMAGMPDGRTVKASGYLIRRGTIDMLMVESLAAVAEAAAPAAAPAEPLGRWRITGEICDGKCYSGGMRPGSGLAHKACANLCIIGEVPPILVSTAPVAGAVFLMLADRDGNKLPDAVRDVVALRLRLDGDLERRGDVLVFKVDITRAAVL